MFCSSILVQNFSSTLLNLFAKYFQKLELFSIWSFFDTLESYTPSERASVESFLDTLYVQVIMHAVRSRREHQWHNKYIIWKEVEAGYKQRILSIKTNTKF